MRRDPKGTAGASGSGAGLLETGRQLIMEQLPPGSSIKDVHALTGGYTDAQVVLCDIGRDPGARARFPAALSGQYILKVELAADGYQAAAHNSFRRTLPDFAADHVPQLVANAAGMGVSADVYEIAGFSLDSLRSAEHVTDFADREEACALVARDLLRSQLMAAGQPDYSLTGAGVLQKWLGANFPKNHRGDRLYPLMRQLTSGSRVFRHEGELLPDPLALFDVPGGPFADNLPYLSGCVHGDLHLRNILVRGSLLTRDLAYWVIDMGWAGQAPLLYDQAYLELAALTDWLGRRNGVGRLLPVLARLDNERLTVSSDLGPEDTGIVRLAGKIREATMDTLRELEPRREDVWLRQLLFARIATGLNWAAKPLGPAFQRAALLSACWATRLLLRAYYPEFWFALAQQDKDSVGRAAGGPAQLAPAEALRLWEPFQSGTGGNTDLFLVADEMTGDERLATLGTCRWAAVIDLDPHSDAAGTSSVVVPVLRELRHASIFGENTEATSAEVATNWLMANGWASHGEASATSESDWRRRGYLARVRRLIDRARDETSRTRAAVVCLRSGKHDAEIDHVVEYIDERYGGIDARLDLAQPRSAEGIDLAWFFDIVGESRPAVSSLVPTLPANQARDGRWKVRRTDLHRLSVDLEVLHSEILSQSRDGLLPSDGFWRGRPPTWGELDAGVDIPRDIYLDLHKDLRDRLADHQLTMIHLAHSPGAGGTTLARRIAWSLHERFPTVLLRAYSTGTIERIDEIYQETGLPVLVIAESADLPESERDELRHGLQQRNSRAVILWVNRTNTQVVPEQPRRSQRYTLLDPLSDTERVRFHVEYSRRATTDQARELLDGLAAGNASVIEPQHLSPFYFGLCVYDAEFVGVPGYVRNHLRQLSVAQRSVARYLALITRYGQQLGLPVDFIQRLLGAARPTFEALSDDQLTAMLGPDLRHFVVEKDFSLRLLHPRIAEEVLTAEGASSSLGRIAVEFIERVTEYFGPNNATTDRLLVALFIKRTWSEDRTAQGNFSDLISAMEKTQAALVFEVLTKKCPDNPHFWNHRGRYHMYKLRLDYAIAEQYLLTAVEKSRGLDGIHQHTLGMVRRLWIEDQLAEIMRRPVRPTPEDALAEIEPLFNLAMEAFREASRGHQTDHVWATPIQLIATVVEGLVKLSGQGNLTEFVAQRRPSAKWVTGQIAVAEELLDNLRNGYEMSPYSARLTNDLATLYGDLDRLVELWKEQQAAGAEDPEISRALARTLFAQSGRDWTEFAEDRVREIAEMAWGPVNEGTASDSDLRLWFQAYRRLPEYSETPALERLDWYYVNRQSLEASYYLYMLHFLAWERGDERNANEVQRYVEECRRLSRLHRRQWSFEWLGIDGRAHPLVHFSELGTRSSRTGFWSRPQQLRRVAGIIEEIQSPQSGKVRILSRTGGQVTAFFVPGKKFLQTRDMNATVEFYLGFSYEGLRAWETTYQGEVPETLRLAEQVKEPSRPSAAQPVTPRATVPPPPPSVAARPAEDTTDDPPEVPSGVPPKTPRRQASPLVVPPRRADVPDDYQGFILALLRDADEHGAVLRSLELGEALQAHFGIESYRRFREDGLRKAIERLGFRTHPTSAGFDVELP